MLHIFSQLLIIKIIMRYSTLAHGVHKRWWVYTHRAIVVWIATLQVLSGQMWLAAAVSDGTIPIERGWPCTEAGLADLKPQPQFRPLVWGCRTWERESESGNPFAMALSSVVSLGKYGLGLKKEDARGSHSTDVDPCLLHTWRGEQDCRQSWCQKLAEKPRGSKVDLLRAHKGHVLPGTSATLKGSTQTSDNICKKQGLWGHMTRACLSDRREQWGVRFPGKKVFEKVPTEPHDCKNWYVAPAAWGWVLISVENVACFHKPLTAFYVWPGRRLQMAVYVRIRQ